MNRPVDAITAAIVFLLLALPALTQERPLLSSHDLAASITRSVQLVESTSLTVPGLARAAAPVLENCKQAQQNLRAGGNRDARQFYSLLTGLRSYLALADALPRPFPFPTAATSQFTELRLLVARLDTHFGALLGNLNARLRNPDRDNLRRYAEDNTRIGAPASDKPRIVFLGDSITDSWRLNEYFPDSDFVNRGISGQITGQMLGRMKADVIDLKPKAVVILAGTNDIARGVSVKAIENNLTMIAELAKLHGVKVILASLLPVHDYNKEKNPRFFRSGQRPPKTILELNDWIRSYCRRNRHTFLDYFSKMVDQNGALTHELSADGLHPNAAGYRVMAPLVWNAIMKVVPQGAGPRQR